MYERETYSQPLVPQDVVIGHFVHGVAMLELFTVSAFERLLVPEVSVGLFGGAGGGAADDGWTAVSGLGGVHVGLTRLRPSGWWFPVFLEVGLEWRQWRSPELREGSHPDAHWRIVAGVGL